MIVHDSDIVVTIDSLFLEVPITVSYILEFIIVIWI